MCDTKHILGINGCGCGSDKLMPNLHFSCDGIVDENGCLIMGLDDVAFSRESLIDINKTLAYKESMKFRGKHHFLKTNKKVKIFSDNRSNILLNVKFSVSEYVKNGSDHRFKLTATLVGGQKSIDPIYSDLDYIPWFPNEYLVATNYMPHSPVFHDIKLLERTYMLSEECGDNYGDIPFSFEYNGIIYKAVLLFLPNTETYYVRGEGNVYETNVQGAHVMFKELDVITSVSLNRRVLSTALSPKMYPEGDVTDTYLTIGSPASCEYRGESMFDIGSQNIAIHVLNFKNEPVELKAIDLNIPL